MTPQSALCKIKVWFTGYFILCSLLMYLKKIRTEFLFIFKHEQFILKLNLPFSAQKANILLGQIKQSI